MAYSSEVEPLTVNQVVLGSIPSMPANIERSSNGRTAHFDCANGGSTPSLSVSLCYRLTSYKPVMMGAYSASLWPNL